MSLVTTLPAPTTVSAPITTPGRTITPVESHAPSPIVTGLGGLGAAAPLDRVQWMRCGNQLHARADLHVLADRDLSAVEDHRPVVDERPGADTDVVAVVALELRHHVGTLTQLADQLAQDRPPLDGERRSSSR